MIAILLLVAVFSLIYLLGIKPYSHWSRKNVPTGKVTPFFGENLGMVLGQENFTDMFQRMYNKLPDVRYIGCYQFQTPILVVKSPELIKQIFVKDFDHFLNRRNIVADGVDDLLSKNLVALKGQTWKNMRCILSPTFTSSKMKSMFVLICRNANLFVKHFVEKKEKIIEIEFKDAFSRYTSDVIASIAFGLDVDSIGDRENEFFLMGKQASDFTSIKQRTAFILYQFAPTIAGLLRLKVISDKVRNFFVNIIKDTIKLREEQNIKRPDMLGLLIEARKGQEKEETSNKIKETSFSAEEQLIGTNIKNNLSDDDILSQAFIFFLAGSDPVSSAMCFMAYELACNPDVQKKLIEEIDENGGQNGTASYETVVNMTYLDMVVSETLRKWPIAAATDRVVTKPYTIEAVLPDEKPVHLEVDDVVAISFMGLHYDPKYFESPEKFDPERFSPENKKNIDPYTYLPFGVGPRNCIASRFALLETKAVFFHLLSHFEIVLVEKTEIPLKISKASFNLTSQNGFHLGLKKRAINT